jgi:hypothetical protein
MALIGIAITKEVTFRDSVQPFSNQYYYANGPVGGAPDVAAANALIDELVVLEKTFHSSLVTFAYARLWTAGLGEILNQMVVQKPLSGVGSATGDSTMDKERAYLFRWRAGVDSRGTPVFLRKWYHTCGVFPGAGTVSSAILANISGFSQASRDAMENNVDNIHTLASGGGGWNLCSKAGRFADNNQPEAHQYLEHHQLGDQWRGA